MLSADPRDAPSSSMSIGRMTFRGKGIRITTLEWLGAWFALTLQTGAILPLVLMLDGEEINAGQRLILQMTHLPMLLYAVVILARRPQLFLTAAARNLALMLLIALGFVSAIWSINVAITIKAALAFVSSALLSFALAVAFTPKQLLSLVAVVLGPLMLLSLMLFIAIPTLGRMPETEELRGVFIHKNPMGWCATLSILASSILAAERGFRHRRLAALCLLASILCLVLSQSMTGLLSCSAAIVFILFYQALPRLSGLGRIVFCLTFLLATIAFGVLIYEFLVPLLEFLEKDATLTGRIPLWHIVDGLIAERLLLGYGYEAFWSDASSGAWRVWSEILWKTPHSHNGIREIMLNFGAVGLVILLWLLGRCIYQGFVRHCYSPEYGWLWLNVYVGMFLVMNITEALIMVQGLFSVLFCVAIISFSMAPTIGKIDGPPARIARPPV